MPWAGVASVIVVRAADGCYLVEPDPTTVVIERHRDLGIEPLFAVEFREAAAERLGGERGERVDDAFRRSLGLRRNGAACVRGRAPRSERWR